MTEVSAGTLTDFLLARLSDDEAELARWCARYNAGQVRPEKVGHPMNAMRLLAECAAKRQLVEHFVRGDTDNMWAEEIGGFLALAYADHEDFRDEWRPWGQR